MDPSKYFKPAVLVPKARLPRLLLTVAKEKDVLRSERLSDGWWEKFMRCHQDKLSLRQEDATAHIRMDSTNFEVIGNTMSF